MDLYLQKHNVRQIFHELLIDLVLNLPEDPIQFLISRLNAPKLNRIFIFGSQSADALQSLLPTTQTIDVLSVDVEITRNLSDTEISDLYLSKIVEYESNKHQEGSQYIVLGFPSTRAQARCMQSKFNFLPYKLIQIGLEPLGITELYPLNSRVFNGKDDLEGIKEYIEVEEQEGKEEGQGFTPGNLSLCMVRSKTSSVFGSVISMVCKYVSDKFGLEYIKIEEDSSGETGIDKLTSSSICEKEKFVIEGFPGNKEEAEFIQQRCKGLLVISFGEVDRDLMSVIGERNCVVVEGDKDLHLKVAGIVEGHLTKGM
jgi:hypothetical protein